MSKTKKIVLSIVFFAIIMGAFTAYILFFAQPEAVTEINDSEITCKEVITKEYPMGYNNRLEGLEEDQIAIAKDIFSSTTGDYIWVEEKYMGDDYYYNQISDGTISVTLCEVSEEYMKEKIYNNEISSFAKDLHVANSATNDINKVKEVASESIERLTKSPSTKKIRTAWSSYDITEEGFITPGIKAFGNKEIQDVDVLNENGSAFFENYNISLSCENVKVERLATSTNMIKQATYYAIVSADVKCKTNDSNLAGTEWIPEANKTNNVTFLMFYTSAKCHVFDMCYLLDLIVLDYKPAN